MCALYSSGGIYRLCIQQWRSERALYIAVQECIPLGVLKDLNLLVYEGLKLLLVYEALSY